MAQWMKGTSSDLSVEDCFGTLPLAMVRMAFFCCLWALALSEGLSWDYAAGGGMDGFLLLPVGIWDGSCIDGSDRLFNASA